MGWTVPQGTLGVEIYGFVTSALLPSEALINKGNVGYFYVTIGHGLNEDAYEKTN